MSDDELFLQFCLEVGYSLEHSRDIASLRKSAHRPPEPDRDTPPVSSSRKRSTTLARRIWRGLWYACVAAFLLILVLSLYTVVAALIPSESPTCHQCPEIPHTEVLIAP